MIRRARLVGAGVLFGVIAACGTGQEAAKSPAADATSAGPLTPTATLMSGGTRPTTAPNTPTPSVAAPATSRASSRSATLGSSSPTALAPVPKAGAEPAVRFPQNPPAAGSGANARVSAIPDQVWSKMVGFSWTPGCPVGRSSLRYVTVNFWGFDGVRSRGALVVHHSIASSTARAFTDLYAQQFRIRQMRPMDSTWGKNPKGPGADDYAAMEADNTSAFNCRYVGGQESRKVYSNHAYGKAIDVNDFENPYVDASGKVYPDSYFLHRRGKHAGVFAGSSSAAVKAFTSRGFSWGGRWSHPDFQHFDG